MRTTDRDGNTPQLDLSEPRAQLEQALAHMKSLSLLAGQAKALAADVEAQQQLLQHKLDKLQAAVLLASAPAGIALTSGEHLQLAAHQNLMLTAGRNADLGVIKRLTIAAGEAISLFAHKAGLKLFAAQGKVEIQAQSDNLELIATKDILQTSGQRIVLGAKDELMLVGNGGSYIKLDGGNVEIGGPGKLLIRTSGVSKQDAANQRVAMPAFAEDSFDEKFIISHGISGEPLPNQRYKITLASGEIIEGLTDSKGQTALLRSQALDGMKLMLGAAEKTAQTGLAAGMNTTSGASVPKERP
ncbi:DUF2345 domain-containing protein [Amantichitinum ursilacus]|uniref:DUF2345 domain-containing protein n=1 Tax=Amantichitinum ursilacus TaxID=857265 RepID=A0A0N0GLH2_9NEIS|nr:DUF2345 domain-containing protein [Amantichitinum ursilacus]KPC49883.1 hypothetical protein WG78_19095 [Amantichitinum ursilacus]